MGTHNRRDVIKTGLGGLISGALAATGLKAAAGVPAPSREADVDTELTAALKKEAELHARFDDVNQQMRDLAENGHSANTEVKVYEPESIRHESSYYVIEDHKSVMHKLSVERSNIFTEWTRAKEEVANLIIRKNGGDAQKVKIHKANKAKPIPVHKLTAEERLVNDRMAYSNISYSQTLTGHDEAQRQLFEQTLLATLRDS